MTVTANININLDNFPKCPMCEKGLMLPLTDETKDKGNVMIKLWACNNSKCNHNVGLQSGKLIKQEINANA